MARRVNLDAMIRREDFARETEGETPPETIRELTLEHLKVGNPIRRLLRKPDLLVGYGCGVAGKKRS